MENTISQYDPAQITRMGFDDSKQAHRVVIEGSSVVIPELKIPEIKFPDNLEIHNKVIEIIKEVPVIVREIEIREIEKPIVVIQKEVQVVEIIKEVPVINEVTKIEFIEKPIIIPQIEVKTIEKPIIIEKIVEKFDKLAISLIASQAIGIIILTIMLLKK